MEIKPIDTRYRGYRFRSRLEARWAVFFQTLGVPWLYEPEGFRLNDGILYLPDFLLNLTDGPLWVEIKLPGVGCDLMPKLISALNDGESRGTVLHEIPDPEDFDNDGPAYSDGDTNVWNSLAPGTLGCSGDNFYAFCVCDGCGAVGFEFEARSARISCPCRAARRARNEYCDRNHTGAHPRIIAALRAARSARFEWMA